MSPLYLKIKPCQRVETPAGIIGKIYHTSPTSLGRYGKPYRTLLTSSGRFPVNLVAS